MRFLLWAACAGALLFPAVWAADNEVQVVVSSRLKPYEEALQGVDGALKKNAVVLSEHRPQISKTCRVVMALGGKAATYDYPKHITLIYWAPGLQIPENQYQGGVVKVHTGTDLNSMVRRIQMIQPSLKRLGTVWITPSITADVEEAKKKGTGSVEIKEKNLSSAEGMPDYLRGIRGHVDALMLMMDPALFTRENMAMIKEFAWANGLPFYVPVDGLLEQGAAASVSVPFEEIGRIMSETASKAISGLEFPHKIFPSKIRIGINMTAAKKSGLHISSEIQNRADRVLP